MRLGVNLGHFSGAPPPWLVPAAQQAERMGYDSVWMAEAYGSDAAVPLAWIGAHTSRIKLGSCVMQMPARTPAMTAMTAATLDLLSGGRFLLGLGPSGPQVVEGWHGVPYGKPLARTREYVAIVRALFARHGPLEHHGDHFDIPYTGPGATGLGKPLKLITHPRPDIPIYLTAVGPKAVRLAAEVADGWLPAYFVPDRFEELYGDVFAHRDLSTFDIAASVAVVLGDDVAACRDQVKPGLALYVGGMGARERNFYYDFVCRLGYEGAAKVVQDLYLDGRKAEAAAAVPDKLVDELALCGPKERVAELLTRWKDSPVGTLVVGSSDLHVLEVMADLVLG